MSLRELGSSVMEPRIYELDRAARAAKVMTSDTDVLSGRRAGEIVRDAIGLGQLGLDDRIIIRVPADRTVTPSFFIGLLAESLISFQTPAIAQKHVEIETGSDVTRQNFLSALRTLTTALPYRSRNWFERLLG